MEGIRSANEVTRRWQAHRSFAAVTGAAPATLPVIFDTNIGTGRDGAYAPSLVLASPELNPCGAFQGRRLDAFCRACGVGHAARRDLLKLAA